MITAPYSFYGNKKYTPVNPDAPILPLPEALKKILPLAWSENAPGSSASGGGSSGRYDWYESRQLTQTAGRTDGSRKKFFNPEGYLKCILDDLKKAVPGNRNVTLNQKAWSAYRLLNYFSVSDLTARMTEIALNLGLPAGEIRATLKRAYAAAVNNQKYLG